VLAVTAMACGVGGPADQAWSRAAGRSAPRTDRALRSIVERLDEAIAGGEAIGAQLAVGDRDGTLAEHRLGSVTYRGRHSVNDDTLFCIGSCSKPMVATILTRLAEEGRVDLDAPVDRWLPELGSLRLEDGTTVDRAPTIRELLCHRGGLFSQVEGLTPRQASLVYGFDRTLAEVVRGIAEEPLLAAPGETFAYSAAGYDVAGRAAEVAGSTPFERLFDELLAEPLGLSTTGYRPAADPALIATGALTRNGVLGDHPISLHLAREPSAKILVGGGVYSTAREVARFARMMAAGGQLEGTKLLSPEEWEALVSRQPFQQSYGLGWRLIGVGEDGCARRIAHEGAIAASRAFLRIDLPSGCFAVVLYTLADPRRHTASQSLDTFVGRRLNTLLDAAASESGNAR